MERIYDSRGIGCLARNSSDPHMHIYMKTCMLKYHLGGQQSGVKHFWHICAPLMEIICAKWRLKITKVSNYIYLGLVDHQQTLPSDTLGSFLHQKLLVSSEEHVCLFLQLSGISVAPLVLSGKCVHCQRRRHLLVTISEIENKCFCCGLHFITMCTNIKRSFV